jgi:hypothetical protein
LKVRTERQLHAQEHVSENGHKLSIGASLERHEYDGCDMTEVEPTGITYKATFLRLSKTKRPNSIETGIDVNLLSSKIIAAEGKSFSY